MCIPFLVWQNLSGIRILLIRLFSLSFIDSSLDLTINEDFHFIERRIQSKTLILPTVWDFLFLFFFLKRKGKVKWQGLTPHIFAL